MSHAVTLTAQETAERLIAVLRDYAEKLSAWNERAADTLVRARQAPSSARAVGVESARLICLKSAIDRSLAQVTQNASGLLEHADLEHVVWLELKLRLDETEEHVRFSGVWVSELKRELGGHDAAKEIRRLVEQSHHKAPF